MIAAAHEQAYPAENKNQDLIVRPLSRLGISTSPQDDTRPVGAVHDAAGPGGGGAADLVPQPRQHDAGVRIGAAEGDRDPSRGRRRALRIVRQLLVQGLMLSLAGGVARLDRRRRGRRSCWSPSMATVLPFALALDVDAGHAVLVSRRCCSARSRRSRFGLWPALRLSRPDLLSSLKDQAGEISGRLGGRITVRGALVTAQLALSLALLVLSGLFVRGAAAGASADPGFELEPLVVAQLDPRLGGYDDVASREARRAMLERLRSTPGIDGRAARRRCFRSATTR